MLRYRGVIALLQRRTNVQASHQKWKQNGSLLSAGTDSILQNTIPQNQPGVILVDREEYLNNIKSGYRDHDGSPIKGNSSREARVTDKTLQGLFPRGNIELNPIVARAINNNIMSLHVPNSLRTAAAKLFVEAYERKLHRPTATAMEVDAHIGAFFLQNYGAIYQTLKELKTRLGNKFNPQRVLDVGYGPATGIVAFNDVMGEDHRPMVKEAVVLGHIEMQKRAKIILSRQLNEVPESSVDLEHGNDDEMNLRDDIPEGDSLVGEIMTKKIRINTKLRNNVPGSKEYDLIIITHQLLRHEHRFPTQVDDNLEHYLKLLAPGGHLVIIERGNPMGFEIVARARQIMIRPENFPNEGGKIPRPWVRGSSRTLTNHISVPIEDTESMRQESEELMKTLDEKYGTVSVADLDFEPEIMEATTVETDPPVKQTAYHLRVLAPCPHHGKCPLQTSKPQLYEMKEGRSLNFCNFQKVITRPKYTIELKKGKVLATPWENPTDGISAKGASSPGTGRLNSTNYETLNWSYLVMERSHDDANTVAAIENRRKASKKLYDLGSEGDGTWETWPRVIRPPLKRKGHVIIDICAPSTNFEKWTISKSFSKEAYHDARKATKGDLWAMGAKTKLKGMGGQKVQKLEKARKRMLRDQRQQEKIKKRELEQAVADLELTDSDSLEGQKAVETLSEFYAQKFNEHNGDK